MMLCLDIGNSRSKAGLFDGDRLIARFERATARMGTTQAFIDGLRSDLERQGLDPARVDTVRACQVVPAIRPVLEAGCLDLFGSRPFWLDAGTQTTLQMDYHNPAELGSDRIAAAIGACRRWPDENLIVVGCGTAVTFCCIDRQRRHLGGAIAAGPGLVAESLHTGTGRLPRVEFVATPSALGRCTQTAIQSGLLFGLLGLVKELSARLRNECFPGQNARLIGTGGYAAALRPYGVFDWIEPDLVLHGLSFAQA